MRGKLTYYSVGTGQVKGTLTGRGIRRVLTHA